MAAPALMISADASRKSRRLSHHEEDKLLLFILLLLYCVTILFDASIDGLDRNAKTIGNFSFGNATFIPCVNEFYFLVGDFPGVGKGRNCHSAIVVVRIDSSWGGSKIEPYMTAESVRRALEGSVPSSRLQHVMDRKNQPKKAPVEVATTWNSRMLPLAGYAARGFIWYQGEANRKDRYYDLLQAAMVDLWRTAWGDKEKKMPFMFTTIAPYRYGDSQATVRPFFVENQLHSLKFIPNSFAAITESLGNEICIHPAKKRQVAQQFLLYALENTYGIKMGMGSGYPKPSGFEFKDGAVTIPFTNTANGLGNINNRKVKGFELAGEDHVFHPAEAEIASDNKSVVVKSAEVPAPIAVRYNFHNYADGDLENSYGVPVPCFRSDDWAEE